MKKYAISFAVLILLLAIAVSPIAAMNVSAADTTTLYQEVTYGQTEARKMLDMINDLRTDTSGNAWYWNSDDTTKTYFNVEGATYLGELTYDYELERTAMLRAAEAAITFDHYRPNGSRCFTAFPGDYMAASENIAAGNSTAAATFNQFLEEYQTYAYQGHRRNMLSPSYNAVGIGHAICGGYHYWAQSFARRTPDTNATAANDSVTVVTIVAANSGLVINTLYSEESSLEMKVGDTLDVPPVLANYTFTDHWPSNTLTAEIDAEWISSNSAVVSVENGTVTAHKYGTAVLTATADGVTAKINVTIKTPLSITSQPKSVSVNMGEKATVSVTAHGDGLKYQWYTKSAGASSFSKSSITTAVYSVVMNPTRDGRQVYCVITDKYGNSVKTNTVTLSSDYKLKITSQPESADAAEGAYATVSVTAAGDGLKYQWWIAAPGSDEFIMSSTTGSRYSVTMNTSRHGRQLYCVITDKYGNSVKTNTVTISMRTPLRITRQPVSVTAFNGEQVSVSLKAQGDGLTYKWYFCDEGMNYYALSSTTKSVYTVIMNESRSSRYLYCIVTDKYGNTVRSNTVLMSMVYMKITSQPESVTVNEGEQAKVTVGVTGEGLKYQWYIAAPGSSTFSKSSTTNSSYNVTMNSSRNGRQLYCIITDKYGNKLKTNTVTINMNTALAITKQPVSVTAAEGKNATVRVTATGKGLKYQWYIANPDSDDFIKSSTVSSIYSVAMNPSRDGRQLYCVITDAYGNTVRTNTVTINMA